MSDAVAALLVKMSPASIDRHLVSARAGLARRGRSHAKPGSLLKSQIPVRTWAESAENRPGFVEIDLVGHEGGNANEEFCFTLTMTDIATGWTVNRSIKNKAAISVCEAIAYAAARFPFPILGIDSDNGSEFINAHLLAYCTEHQITFARSRGRALTLSNTLDQQRRTSAPFRWRRSAPPLERNSGSPGQGARLVSIYS